MNRRGSAVRIDGGLALGEAMRAQQALLRAGTPALHVAVLRTTTLSVGVAVAEDAPYLQRARELGIPATRRSSGGTGILHLDHDLVWAIVLPRSDPLVGRDFVQAYPRFGAGVVTALAHLGVACAWVPAPGLSDEYCPLGSRGQVLEASGRVVGAAAQHLSATALLHHGTLSLRVDRELVARLFPSLNRSSLDRLAGLDERGVREVPSRIADEVGRALADSLGMN